MRCEMWNEWLTGVVEKVDHKAKIVKFGTEQSAESEDSIHRSRVLVQRRRSACFSRQENAEVWPSFVSKIPISRSLCSRPWINSWIGCPLKCPQSLFEIRIRLEMQILLYFGESSRKKSPIFIKTHCMVNSTKRALFSIKWRGKMISWGTKMLQCITVKVMSKVDADCLTLDKDVTILDNVGNICSLIFTTTFGLSLQLWKWTKCHFAKHLTKSAYNSLAWC